MFDQVSDEEIGMLLDGELSPDQQAAVQERLAGDAPRAAAFFKEATRMHALRASQTFRASSPRAHHRRAIQLGRRLQQYRRLAALRTPILAACFVAVGWVAGTSYNFAAKDNEARVADENFLNAAREALRVAQLDSESNLHGESGHNKIARLVNVMNIGMPTLPKNWAVTNVQVQPWQGTESLVVTADTPRLGRITLVATSMKGEQAVPLRSADDGRIPTVYWQSGGTAYALMSAAPSEKLETEAKEIEVATRRNVGSKYRG